MRPQGQTFWQLGGNIDWRTGHAEGVAVSEGGGMRLAADPAGPFSLLSADGSLGGLIQPLGMGLDASLLPYLLEPDQPFLSQFDPESQQFKRLCGIGGEGSDARQFKSPTNIAIIGSDLYISDCGNRRVQVFSLNSLALRHVWGPWDEGGCRCAVDDEAAWQPLDVYAGANHVYVLDRRYGRVYRHTPGHTDLEIIIDDETAANRWSRIAVDRDERLYLLDAGIPHLDIFNIQGEKIAESDKAGELRPRFSPPVLRLDHAGRFCLPAELARNCRRSLPADISPPAKPVGIHKTSGLCFWRTGQAINEVNEAELAGPRLYTTSGQWISEPLDSQRFNCQWHRIEQALTDLPPGTQINIKTYTDNELRNMDDIRALSADRWAQGTALIGAMQARVGEQPSYDEQLAQSQQGQYLWLCLELSGDGYATPIVQTLRIHYPRDSYLKYLPALYAADRDSNWFLQRFLSIFQTEWDGIEKRVMATAQYYDADAVPAGPHMQFLAKWFDERLSGQWDGEQNRQIIKAAQKIRARRGTPRALRDYLQAHLHNITGILPEQQRYPILVEGYRERDYVMVSHQEHAQLDSLHPLWSPLVVGRLQLEVFSHEGEVRLLSTGDPDRDVFHQHAHRFKVYLPSAWVRNADDERLLRQAVDKERPAHTAFDFCLVEPRFQVGYQSTIGLDTILGDYPRAVLGGCDEENIPPSQMPRQRLGYDTVLSGGESQSGGALLAPGLRVGLNTMVS